MSKIVITGVNGFVGHHVARQLHASGFEILGLGTEKAPAEDLKHIVNEYVGCDLTNPEQVKRINLSNARALINLAGLAQVGASKNQGELYDNVNIGVHTVLYEECVRQNTDPRIIAVSTGAVYDPEQSMPITEDSALIPAERTNEYVISKQKMEARLDAFREQGLRIIVARPFNHSGPGQAPGFLIPDLSEQIAEAVTTKQPLLVGNLLTKRDYTDVRDVARAYVLLATCDDHVIKHNLYNICSGRSFEGRDIFNLLIKAFGATDINVEIDQNRLRPNDVLDIYGSSARLREDTGWKPEFSLEQMITDYADWKKQNA